MHPSECDAEWSILQFGNESVLLQISTFGSDERQSHPKVSQTLQIDHHIATQLKLAIEAAFPDA